MNNHRQTTIPPSLYLSTILPPPKTSWAQIEGQFSSFPTAYTVAPCPLVILSRRVYSGARVAAKRDNGTISPPTDRPAYSAPEGHIYPRTYVYIHAPNIRRVSCCRRCCRCRTASSRCRGVPEINTGPSANTSALGYTPRTGLHVHLQLAISGDTVTGEGFFFRACGWSMRMDWRWGVSIGVLACAFGL